MEASSKQVIAFVLCLRAFPEIALSQTRDGILGHTWGSPVAAVAEPLELHSPRFDANVILYATGMHDIGDAPIDQCQIEFVNGKLAGVIVTTCGPENSGRLLAILKKEYGEGNQQNPRALTWMTPETHLSYDLDSFGDAYVYWYSVRLQK
jgi:hypothetical protein